MSALALCARLTCFGLVVWCAPWLAVRVVSPQNRASLVVSGVNAAKEAGVKHLVVLSVSTADIVSVLFGRQFHEIETAVKASGLAWTLVRLPIFTDNLWYVLAWGRRLEGGESCVCRETLGRMEFVSCMCERVAWVGVWFEQGSGRRHQGHRQVLRSRSSGREGLVGEWCVVRRAWSWTWCFESPSCPPPGVLRHCLYCAVCPRACM